MENGPTAATTTTTVYCLAYFIEYEASKLQVLSSNPTLAVTDYNHA